MQQKRGKGSVSAVGSSGLSRDGAYKRSNAARIDIEARIGRAVGGSESSSNWRGHTVTGEREASNGWVPAARFAVAKLVSEVLGLEEPASEDAVQPKVSMLAAKSAAIRDTRVSLAGFAPGNTAVPASDCISVTETSL